MTRKPTRAINKKRALEGGVGAAAAMVARARRNVISHFMSCNAVSTEKAVSFTPSRSIERRILDRYIRAGVIVPTSTSAYYIDVPTYDAYRNNRKRNVGVAMALLALAGGVAVGILG
ncbi:hypothetical protein [Sphingomonas sp. 32-62-10]|uniref:hypothetical protein n=1 Tax=Sphingomonas sp. 32-62-10 TaxID=1970436 RepID=UPI0035A9539A